MLPKSPAARPQHRCTTMELLAEAIKKDPTLEEKWRQEGERQWAAYQKRQNDGSMARTQAGEIVIPIVFHLVDAAATLAGITDRDIYEQVEQLNRDYNGLKLDYYRNVVPTEMAARVGRIPVRFTLARRTPAGALTTGIERRANTTPSHVNIKSFANGGLDVWDTARYVNVWAGTFSGADNGLLGIATFPFTGNTEGPQGVVIGITTLPYTSATARGYYPTYSEGATLTHELGHYFYLWHTFGDLTTCNNQDFRLQAGWPLPTGAGPEGDDTPAEKYDGSGPSFGNPSLNYSDGCATETFGEMYGSYMNYFDDRALFMFSEGMRKRVQGCIDAYRPNLKTSNGATPPSAITDAFLVNVSARGIPERRSFVVNNTPFQAYVRNNGTTTLTGVTVNVSVDGGTAVATNFTLNLAAGRDTTLNLAAISGSAGNHTLTVYTTAPNTATDAFTNNDTLQSFINISTTSVSAPLTERFDSTTFGATGWRVWNPNNNTTWTRSTTAGFTAAGSATVGNYNYNGPGQMDELISPVISYGASDSSVLSFRVAYGVYDLVDVSTWDGLEVYVSGDGGQTYNLAYKKTGNQLRTIAAVQTGAFTALPTQPDRWRLEQINLSPYIRSGQNLIVKFRNTNAYGNNLYIDDIGITAAVKPQIDLVADRLINLPDFTCNTSITPSISVKNIGSQTVNNFRLTYIIDNGTPVVTTVTATVGSSQSTTVALPAITATPGTHLLTVIANFPNGAAEPNPLNDTLRKIFVVVPTVTAPLVESFEGPGSVLNGLPSGWAVTNPDASNTWARTNRAARKIRANDSSSAYMRNFGYTGTGLRDELYTPKVNFSGADSVYMRFDISAATYNYPGATAVAEDTLEILVTKDCGVTFQSVYKKWGTDLQSLRAPNDPVTTEYFPANNNDWKTDSVYLTPYVGAAGTFQVVFRNTHNAPGNNIFLDNINIFTEVLPAALKQQGFLILPTAFTSRFSVWHFNQPTALTGIGVYNSVGQLVWSKQYNRNADRTVNVDLSSMAAGVYFVNLRYTDANRNVTQKVIKY